MERHENDHEEEHHDARRVEMPRRIPMLEYAQPSLDGARPSIVRPMVRANQFEIKPAIIQIIQNTVQLHLFPFSLRDKSKAWLNCLPVGSITTWEDMAKAFIIKYFPPSKTMKLRADITTFAQFEQESLYEAWERFKDLLRRCPHHELPHGLVVQTFYYGLLTPNRTMIDAAACGNLLRKTAEEGYELLEEMAASSYHPQSERNNLWRSAGVHQVTDLSAITAQLEVLNRKLDGLNMGGTAMRLQEISCEKCGGEHFVKDCQDDNPFYVQNEAPVNQVGVQNRSRNDPYSNTYNPGWRQHPNFSWGGQNSQNRPQGEQPYGKQPMYRSDPLREEKSNLEQMMSKFISSTETRLQNQDASIKGLENQIGQLAKMIASREPGTLPSNTETNPKEQVKAIELKSGKVLESREKEKTQKLDEHSETSKGQTGCAIRKLGLGEPKPTRMSLQLADRSVKYPRGVIEYVLVKVDKFIFPADFVVLDMEEDMEMPLILGRPFLAPGKALIDVQEGKLRLRVGDEEITFDVFNALKHTLQSDSCYRIDAFDAFVSNYVQDALRDPLEAILTTEQREDDLDEEKAEIVAYLNANQPWKRQIRMRLEDLGDRRDLIPQKSILEEPPTLELKPLPPNLKYIYLGEHNTLPVIISATLTDVMEDKLLEVLKAHKSAFAWKVADIKGINPSVCMHKILMEDKYSPLVQPQRRLNPKMQEAYENLNKRLVTAPVLVAPDWDLPFEVMCDASDSAVGAVLGQRQNKVFHTIYYANKKDVENVVADHLSRLELVSNDCVDQAINDWFPDEQLFEMKHCPWCVAEEEFGQILNHCHDREVGGHFGPTKGRHLRKTKKAHDRRIIEIEFKEGENVLLYNSRLRLFLGKLKSRWSGPFVISKVYPSGAVELHDGKDGTFTVNAQRLKHYMGGTIEPQLGITQFQDNPN
ncbi:uncharacterized protein LOC142528372 [Primulina tabacum]|uniref:uncharacterized protein LOC142528372 n=1 Tax=Primulina tabacum TaxID=48773 RepID=UPI003F59B08A